MRVTLDVYSGRDDNPSWDLTPGDARQLVELGREGYRAFVAIWEDERAAACQEQPDTSCADELQVIEEV